ncbi:hypothetical protein [Lysobacter sp. Root494]|uniref:hypothetical protein n=1 Tax=Lysobacter sp. Root494 TaxID=1736549 RepID=UPI0012FB7312|nr:hypothetical protein [Lysobacter sp. Root494]
MSNWFENNATKSVLIYTAFVITSTWAVSTFILNDNRVALVQRQLDAQRAQTDQYKSKVELLQRDVETARAENAEYRQWLSQTKDAIPVMVPRVIELTGRIKTLEAENSALLASGTGPKPKEDAHSATLGTAFIDQETGLIFTVKDTTPSMTATVLVKFPESGSQQEYTISAGQQWSFKLGTKRYTLTVTEISFLGDRVSFQITRLS